MARELSTLKSNQGGPRTTGLILFCFQLFTGSNPHVDRRSNPLPWDPLRSPQTLI